MRSTWLIIMLLGIIQTSWSQFEQEEAEPAVTKDYFVGGSLSFNISNNDQTVLIPSSVPPILTPTVLNRSSTRFSTNLILGKQINPHWALGLQGALSLLKNENENVSSSVESETTGIGMGVFARYTVNPTHKFQAIITPNINYTQTTTESSSNNPGFTPTDFQSRGLLIGASLGALYHITPRWRATVFVGGVSYRTGSTEQNDMDDDDFSSFDISFSLSNINFGAEYLF